MATSSRPRPSATASRQPRGPTPLPTYQAPLHPLNASAQLALQNLHRDHKLETLKNKLRVANNHLTTAAADLNDRQQVQNANYERIKKKMEKQGSQADEQDRLNEEARQKTDGMTGRLDEGVRKIIDASTQVEHVEKALHELQTNVSDGRGRVVPTQSTLGASQFRPSHVRRRPGGVIEDEDDEFEDPSAETLKEDECVVGVLKRKIANQDSAYQAMSMAQRYAHHNDYVGFKKLVHDAQYPSDSAPPMPHASTWFPSEASDLPDSQPKTRSGAAAGKNKNHDPIEDSDQEVAVASERVSIKCPITLLPMKDPVTSQKCPHSFEKEAITSMINASDIRVGGSGRRGDKGGDRAMKCPVCEVLLTAADLAPNPVLVRKIRRIQAAMDAPHEGSSDEDEEDPKNARSRANNRPEEVGSSPFATRTPRLKSERMSQAPPSMRNREVSMVPNSQVPPSTSATDVVSMEGEEEDDEEPNDEEIED